MPHPQVTYTPPTVVERCSDHTHIAFGVVADGRTGREILTVYRDEGSAAITLRDTATERTGFIVIPDPILPTVLAEIRHLKRLGPADGCALAGAGCPCGGAVDHGKAGE